MSDKKNWWLRLQWDFFDRHDIKILEAMPNGKDYALFYLKLLLESVRHDGELRFSETIPYNVEMLSVITNTNIDVVRAAMEVLQELNLVEILDDATIYMTEINKMIGSCSSDDGHRENNRIRQQRYRERKNALSCNDVTLRNVTNNVTENQCNVTDNVTRNTEKELKKEKELKLNNKSAKAPVYFSDEALNNAFSEYVKMRKAIKAAMTDHAIDLAIKKLEKLSNGDNDVALAIINESVEHSWKSFYPLKDKEMVVKKDDYYDKVKDLLLAN